VRRQRPPTSACFFFPTRPHSWRPDFRPEQEIPGWRARTNRGPATQKIMERSVEAASEAKAATQRWIRSPALVPRILVWHVATATWDSRTGGYFWRGAHGFIQEEGLLSRRQRMPSARLFLCSGIRASFSGCPQAARMPGLEPGELMAIGEVWEMDILGGTWTPRYGLLLGRIWLAINWTEHLVPE